VALTLGKTSVWLVNLATLLAEIVYFLLVGKLEADYR
jgi:hypothetical protein